MFSISSDALVPSVLYAVMVNPKGPYYTLVSGRIIQQGGLQFWQYDPEDVLETQLVRVLHGSIALAIWRDPSRPELNIPRDHVPQEILARPDMAMAEDQATEIAPVVEVARAVEETFSKAAQRFAQSLYVPVK